MKSQVENINRAGLGWSILFPILVGLLTAALCAALYLREAGQAEKILRGLRAFLASGQQPDLDRAVRRVALLNARAPGRIGGEN
jgi:hypothetical protein